MVSTTFLTICNLPPNPYRHNVVLVIKRQERRFLMYFIPRIRRLVFQLGLPAVVPVLGWSQTCTESDKRLVSR
jgi:hypothetical protein